MQIRITFLDLLDKIFNWEYISNYFTSSIRCYLTNSDDGTTHVSFLDFLLKRLVHLHGRFDEMLNRASGNRGLTLRGLTIPLVIATVSYIFLFKWKSKSSKNSLYSDIFGRRSSGSNTQYEDNENDQSKQALTPTATTTPKVALNPRQKRKLVRDANRRDRRNSSDSSNNNNNDNDNDKGILSSKYVEICLSDIESVREAVQGGCDSIELCCNRIEGGITPSVGLVEEAVRLCKLSGVEIHVLIRPRPGMFTYSDSEFDTIVRDVLLISKLGVTGFVIGILTNEGQIDLVRMKIIRSLASNVLMTFHRAIDVCMESISSCIDKLIEMDCDRVLTSGKQSSAIAGADTLNTFVSALREKQSDILVIAAAGVSPGNVSEIIEKSNVDGVHAGSSVTVPINDSYHYNNKRNNNNDNDIDNVEGDSDKKQSSVAFMGTASGGGDSGSVEVWSKVSRALVATLCLNAKKAWKVAHSNDYLSGITRGGAAAAVERGTNDEDFVEVHREDELPSSSAAVKEEESSQNDLNSSYVHVSDSKE